MTDDALTPNQQIMVDHLLARLATAEHRIEELTAKRVRAKLKGARYQQRRTHENIVNLTESLAAAEHRIEELTAERDKLGQRMKQEADAHHRNRQEHAEAKARWNVHMYDLRALKTSAESQVAALTAERDQLRRQVREFRLKCDPGEKEVLVTGAEMRIP